MEPGDAVVDFRREQLLNRDNEDAVAVRNRDLPHKLFGRFLVALFRRFDLGIHPVQ